MGRSTKRFIRSVLDILVLAVAFVLAWVLRFEGSFSREIGQQVLVMLPYVVALQYGLTALWGGRRHSWRYVGLAEVLKLVGSVAISGVVLVAVRLAAPHLVGVVRSADYGIIPFGVIVIDMALATWGLVALRTLRRLQVYRRETTALARRAPDAGTRSALLVGAGRTGVAVAREIDARPDLGLAVRGFLDAHSHMHGQILHGIPVLGPPEEAGPLAEELDIDEVIIASAHATGTDIRRIMADCERLDVAVKVVPGLHEIVGGHVNLSRIRPVAIEDLLRRDPVELDMDSIEAALVGQVVIVTGAGGSIGAELARQIVRFAPRILVLLERSEPALWAVHRELAQDERAGVELVPVVGDVGDAPRMDQVFTAHRPTVVFHAAAHKHVPLMEANPHEAVRNNVIGTQVLADRAARHGVARFVNVSTDKAVNPTSVMGATKRAAERYVQHLAHETGAAFASVRFGNVLGSNGSVVPIFQDQIASGGPVTVTDPQMTRYFMTIPEAASLVLQAGALGTGGEIFVLDMGEPVRIVDLAEDVIRLSGLVPGHDIDIAFTGQRPGEKLFEELALNEETASPTSHPKVWIGRHSAPGWPSAIDDLAELAEACRRGGREKLVELICRLVPEYTPDAGTAGQAPTSSPHDADHPSLAGPA